MTLAHEPAALPEALEECVYGIFFELPQEQREAEFARVCSELPAHRELLQRLWADLGHSDAVLRAGRAPEAPAAVGPYRIVRELGRGGCGVVYLAEQEQPIRREVAVKLILPGLHSNAILLRFERERQALAHMNHAHVAQVFDAGTTGDGRPYVVMEYVAGRPITGHADAHRLDLTAPIELFLQVCDGVLHAHQRGLLHRDLKPSNLLVAEVDGVACVKVIDFGLAKALQREPEPLQTIDGWLLGTPDYMSPEQTGGALHDLDTRTDIYSLGVVLYELLVGVLPFDLDASAVGLESALRRIREQEAPRPGSRLSQLGARADAIAACRGIDAVALGRALRGDLEWILLQALAKERERRYGTVAGFAEDLRRSLRNEPVVAAPPDLWYRTSKYVRRHRAQVTAAFLLLVVVLGALIALSLVEAAGHRRESAARREAEDGRYVADVAAAQTALEVSAPQLARQHLAACPEGLRDFEWRLLSARMHGAARAIDYGGQVRALQFTLDSARLCCGLSDGRVVIQPTVSGTPATTLIAHTADVHGLAFTPDGGLMASGGDRTVKLWNTLTWEMVRALEFDFAVGRVGISPDGTWLVVLGWQGPVVVQRLQGGERWELPARGSYFRELAFHPREPWLAVTTHAGQVRLYDLTTHERIAAAALSDGEVLHNHHIGLSFLPRDERLVAFRTDGSIALCSVPALQVLKVFNRGSLPIGLAVLPDGRIATGSYEGTVRIWEPAGEPVTDYCDQGGWVQGLAASPDGRWLASGTSLGSVCIFNAADVGRIDRLDAPRTGTTRLCVSGDGGCIAMGDARGDVRLVDPASGEELGMLHGHTGIVASVACAPDGRHLASASDDGSCRLWDLASSASEVIERRDDMVRDAAFHPHEPWLACAGNASPVRIWNLQTRSLVRELHGPPGCCSLRFDGGGSRLLAGGNDGSAWLWDLHTFAGRQLQLPGNGNAFASFSNDGRLIALVSGQDRLRILDAATLQELHVCTGHEGEIHAVPVFSRDDQRVFTTGTDKTLRIWDAARGRLVCTLGGHREWIPGLGIDPGGRWLVTSDNLGNGRIWSTVPLAEQIEARRIARADKAAAEAFLDGCFAQGLDAAAARAQAANAAELSPGARRYVERMAGIRGCDADDLALRSFDLTAPGDTAPAQRELAARLANAAFALVPQSPLVLRARGAVAYRAGDFTAAGTALQEARARNRARGEGRLSESLSALHLEVLCLLQLGRSADAERMLAAMADFAADSIEPALPGLRAEVARARAPR